jgi:ornithine cyclodeaminase/alanine dehydrogenase-like protein (mu-crystallin family)
MTRLRIVSAKDLRRAVKMPEAIKLMRNAFAELSSGAAIIPQRIVMEMQGDKSRSIIMPAYSPGKKRYSVKMVTLAGNNSTKGLPFIQGLLLLFDSDSGAPLALMDAEYMTALRTGAASGLATELLAREDARVAMVFGAGAQARTQLEGIAAARKFERVLVFSLNKSDAEQFSEEMSPKLDLEIVPVDSRAKISEADVVCTATTSEVPVFEHADLKPGVHINGIGSYKATMRELPSETIRHAKIVVDSRSAALGEAGDIVIPIKEGIIASGHIHAELGEIVLGIKPARTSREEITIFKSVGNAVQDLAIASRVFDLSQTNDIGYLVDV